MIFNVLRKLFMIAGVVFSQAIFAQSPTVIRIAAPDLSAGAKHAAGGVTDVLYTKRWIENEFAKDHIKVQWYFFKGAGPAINEALANNQIDFAFLGDLPPIIGKARGLDTQLLVPTTRGLTNYLAVRSDLNVKKLSDIKGKRIGILRGTADELSLIAALQSQGLSIRDVRLVNLDFNAVNAALAAKRIDASWGPARFIALRDKGIVKLPVSTRQLNGAGASQGVFLGSQKFIKAYPKETQRLVNQVVNGLYWLSQEKNRIPQIALFFTQASYPASVYAQELHGVNFKFLYSPLFDQYYLTQLQQKINLAQSQGLIRQPIQLKSWVNPQFANQAIVNLKLQQYWQPTATYDYLKK
ncbi:aryl sulfate ester ABC transporter [Acinetobacter qingfengensis]|uniref:Aryl sulfate ester ABC transporter n=2 Tax=Acinetobacter qingfengensis TaxID=1262585 RepID=A0A1E7R3N5_9GAMM|nr:ABC transporter substrate-binding protein [Acinetobacter qingfengensis]KAA8735708.1 aryl sulfate ester ABC transporter [Acinetobacter qingfengensis]OEY93906.1 aryl sulfate ester ABC transporter [Acinetobacter qingfengensis]